MRFLYVLVLIANLAFCQTAHGQGTAEVGIPTMGFVYDARAMGVRPMIGTRGAAMLGRSLDLGFPVARVAIAAQQKVLLASSSEDHLVRVVRFHNRGMAAQILDGALTSPNRVIFGRSGDSAILYNESAGRLQVITGFPDTPVVSREFSTADLGRAAADPAVSDGGESVLYISSDHGGNSVWLLSPQGGVSRLALPASTVLVSFRPDSRDALAVTRTGELYRIGARGAVSHLGFIGSGDRTGEPVGAQLSSDGTRAYIAYSQGALAILDSTTGASGISFCPCTPSSLSPLNSSAMFQLNEVSPGRPLLLMDASSAVPRVWFVPPHHDPADSQESEQ